MFPFNQPTDDAARLHSSSGDRRDAGTSHHGFSGSDGGPFAHGDDGAPTAGELLPDGTRRFVFSGSGAPRVTLGCVSGQVTVRPTGEEGANAATIRVTDETGAVVPLERYADVTFDPINQLLRVEQLDAMRRQFHHVLRGVTFRHGNIFEHLVEFVQVLAALGIRWPVIDFDVTVPRATNLEVSNASGPIDVAGIEGTTSLRTASGPIRAQQLTGTLSVRTVSGTLDMRDTRGAVHAHTVSGRTTIAKNSGSLIVHTVSGDVRLAETSGSLGFKSVSGDLSVTGGTLGELYANATSGDVLVDTTLQPGDHEFRTVSGGIKLVTQPGFRAKLSGRTVSGRFDCRIPYTRDGADAGSEGRSWDRNEGRRRGKNRWEYLLGPPAASASETTRLRIRTISGSLVIESRPQGAAHEQSQTPPTGASPDNPDGPVVAEVADLHPAREDRAGVAAATTPEAPNTYRPAAGARGEEARLAVLEAVRRNEVTTDEALRLLSELEGAG